MSILDNDAYKFYMQRLIAFDRTFRTVEAQYEFINRGDTKFPDTFADELYAELDEYNEYFLSSEEKAFLRRNCSFLGEEYLDFLEDFRFDSGKVDAQVNSKGDLKLYIEGSWAETILWEVPLMATISELYFSGMRVSIDKKKIYNIAYKKAQRLRDLGAKFADFGTRRRFSREVHELVVQALVEGGEDAFLGTSNMDLAYRYGVKPIGTVAHEFIMAMAALFGVENANRMALHQWYNVYKGNLGIALPDTYTSDVFFREFSALNADRFRGLRQDSGDPIEFAKTAIKTYERLGIDSSEKTIVFSDGLNLEKVEEIVKFCATQPIKAAFGIGTNFTNDIGVECVTPLNMVIKLSACGLADEEDYEHAVKLSDVPGKHTGDKETIKLYKKILGVKDEKRN